MEECHHFSHVTKILNQIKKLNINKIVTKNQICTQDDFFMPGKEIYGMIFDPIIFDRFCMVRMEIFRKIGLFDFKDMTIEHRNIFSEALKKKFSSYTWVIIADPPNRVANQLASYDMIYRDSISNPETNSLFQNNRRDRQKFFEQLKESNYTTYQIVPTVDASSYYFVTLLHDATVLEELPKMYKKIIKKRKEQRYWVSRVLMRKNLPSDLVPLICAFTIVGSKIYDYT